MKLIVCFVLICCVVETVHCSKPAWLWNYLKQFDSLSVDAGDNDHGLVMPLQVRTSCEYCNTSYRTPSNYDDFVSCQLVIVSCNNLHINSVCICTSYSESCMHNNNMTQKCIYTHAILYKLLYICIGSAKAIIHLNYLRL